MSRKKQADAARIGLLEAKVSTAQCVPGIREKVKAWRKHQLMKRGVGRKTTKYAKYTNPELLSGEQVWIFRVFRVFRGSKIFLGEDWGGVFRG